VWYVAVVLENGFRIRWRSIPMASGCDRRCVKLGLGCALALHAAAGDLFAWR
jgi:hypothetical protein